MRSQLFTPQPDLTKPTSHQDSPMPPSVKGVNCRVPRANAKGVVVIVADPRRRACSEEERNFVKSQPTTIKAGYPLRLLLPETASAPTGCPWIYPLTYGGGLVGGDSVELNITVRENCCALLTSQESSKVYHCDGDKVSSQTLNVTIHDGGLMCVLQDPVVCFKDANYTQTQVVNMGCHGNLALLDWYLAGRVARDESWEFHRFVNRLDVVVDSELVLREHADMRDTPNMTLKVAMGRWQVMATFVMLGEKLKDISSELYTRFGLPQEFGSSYRSNCMVSATKLSYDVRGQQISGVLIKVMAHTTVQAFAEIKEMVDPLIPIVGGNPFVRKY
ncbi:uncharacterized protein LOC135465841 [Liolophura sinensis]|uniref:uncharacterized protein LOC135465841 n=1 Tax=Liolophura sinensis TaxID=3198878 RepID=UPI0031598632